MLAKMFGLWTVQKPGLIQYHQNFGGINTEKSREVRDNSIQYHQNFGGINTWWTNKCKLEQIQYHQNFGGINTSSCWTIQH